MTAVGQSYTVALTNFEGPLDLLLALIERKELVVTEVSIAQVTGDYLATITALDKIHERELTWFLDIATRLVVYKSRALVPSSEESNQDQSGGSMAELTAQLARYKKYRDAARKLGQLWGDPLARRSQPIALLSALPPLNLTIQNISSSSRALAARAQARVEPPRHRVTITRSDIARIMNVVLERIVGKKSIYGLIPNTNRRSAVTHLLAVLELIKREVVDISVINGEAYVVNK